MTTSTTIEHIIDIDASPSIVYRMWTSSVGLTSWWGVTAEVDARIGGIIRVDIDGNHVMRGEFTELREPFKVAFTFGWEHEPPGGLAPGTTAVDVSIDAVGQGCRLTLRHAGLPLEQLTSHTTGWTKFLGIQQQRSSEGSHR